MSGSSPSSDGHTMSANEKQEEQHRHSFTLDIGIQERWRKVGAAKGLDSISQIATYLLEEYESIQDGVDPAPRCIRCHSPLALLCARCDFPQPPDNPKHWPSTSSSGTTHTASPASSSFHVHPCDIHKQYIPPHGDFSHSAVLGTVHPASGISSVISRNDIFRQNSSVASELLDIKLEPVTSQELSLHARLDDSSVVFGMCKKDKHCQSQIHKTPTDSERTATVKTVTVCGKRAPSKCRRSGRANKRAGKAAVRKKLLLSLVSDPAEKLAASENGLCTVGDGGTRKGRETPDRQTEQTSSTDGQTRQTLDMDWSVSEKDRSRDYTNSGTVKSETVVEECVPSQRALPKTVGKRRRTGASCRMGSAQKQREKIPSDMPAMCKECGATYSHMGNLKLHVMREHTGERPFVCEVCGVSFIRAVDLARHTRQKHTGERPFACDLCDSAFAIKGSLTAHMRIHEKDKPHICDICGAGFTYKGSLNTHMRVHTKDKPFSCAECGQSFTQHGNLLIHMRKHTGERPYLCKECGMAFRQAGTLKTHYLTHTGERPFKCVDCGRGLTTASSLKIHRRTHTGDRPYICKHCGAAFTNRAAMNRHIRKHTGERPYTCKFCGFAFVRSHHLKTHIKRKHTFPSEFEHNLKTFEK